MKSVHLSNPRDRRFAHRLARPFMLADAVFPWDRNVTPGLPELHETQALGPLAL